MTERRRVERVLDFNLNAMQQRAYVGVRRAVAFLGMSERFLEGEFPRSLTLGRNIKRQFLPDPLPEGDVPELREAWQTWIIGNALRELDQFLSLYLDEAFDKMQQAKLVSGEHPPHYQWQRVDGITNVADKHRRVLEAANRFERPHDEDHACLVSLSRVRNCLSHDLGIVTPKRVTDGILTVRWLAFVMVFEQGEQAFIADEASFPPPFDPEQEALFNIRVEIAERRFAVGDHIFFSPDDLLGICLFYQIVIDRVAQAVAEYAQECGVVFGQAQAQPAEA
jgi:hypothetical protein